MLVAQALNKQQFGLVLSIHSSTLKHANGASKNAQCITAKHNHFTAPSCASRKETTRPSALGTTFNRTGARQKQ
jgi:hypothetical protein